MYVKKEKISTFLHGLFWVCFGLMYIYIFSARNAEDFPFFRIEVIIVLGIILYIVCKKDIPKFAIILFAVSFIIRLIVIILVKTEPASDFKLLYNAAEMLSRGDFSFNQDKYFQTWSYQVGFVVWEAFFLKIWDSIWILKIVNCLLSAGLNLLVYLIAKEVVSNDKPARFVSIIYMIFPFSIFHVTVLTNSHASAFFLFLGLYFLIAERTFKGRITRYIASAISIAFGNLLRPDGLVVLVSIIAALVFGVLKNEKAREIKVTIGKGVLFFVIYFMVVSMASGVVQMTGISPQGLGNENPLWKFVLGTNYESNGSYSVEDAAFVQSKMKEKNATYNEIEIPMIRERILNKKKMLCLFDKKVNIMWWRDAIGWSFSEKNKEDYPELIEWICNMNKAIWSIVLTLIGISVKEWYTKGKRNLAILLIPFLIFSTFIVYLMIEVQPRYLYLGQIAVFIMAAGGTSFVWEMLMKIKKQMEHI